MRRCGFALLLLVGMLPVVNGQLRTGKLSKPVGNANTYGFAVVQKELGRLNVGGSLKNLPIVLEFNASPRLAPKNFGAYWNIAFLNTEVKLLNKTELEWIGFNGWPYYFSRSLVQSRQDCDLYTYGGGGWQALLYRNGTVVVQSTSDPGLAMEYRGGILHRFKMGANCDAYQVSYTSDGNLKKISNVDKKITHLEVEYGSRAGIASAIKVNERTFNLSYIAGELTSPDGVRKWSGYRIPLLAEIKSDGDYERFSYEIIDPRVRQVVMDNFRESRTPPVPVNRMYTSRNGVESGWVEWCAISGMIMADSGGVYKIGNRQFDQFYPERRAGAGTQRRNDRRLPSRTTINYQRTGSALASMWSYDWDNAREFWQDGVTGEIKRYSFIAGSGPARLKLRKIEKFTGGNLANEQDGDAWEMVSTWNYDSSGRLLRVFYGNGDIYRIERDSDGRELKRFMNDTLLAERKFNVRGELISHWQMFKGREFLSEYEDGLLVRRFMDRSLIRTNIYDRQRRLIEERESSGAIITYIYNGDDSVFYRVLDFPDRTRHVVKCERTGVGREGYVYKSLYALTSEGATFVYDQSLKAILSKGETVSLYDKKIEELLRLTMGNSKD